ncbi:hypothetical protein GW17_00050212 [Ensete ventricosum]|nr:hypothetical protein GW17_00050212 [Ensete ventricosum]
MASSELNSGGFFCLKRAGKELERERERERRGGGAYAGQEAHQGLHLVPGQGVADEGQGLAADEVEEPGGVEAREVAAIGLPPPLEEVQVRPAVLHAVLVLLDGEAGLVGVVGGVGVPNPFALGQIAVLRQADGRVPPGVGEKKDLDQQHEDNRGQHHHLADAVAVVLPPKQRRLDGVRRRLHGSPTADGW